MPVLDAFYRRYHGQGLEMIGLSADRPHDRSDVSKVMQSFSYPAAMLDDAKVNDFGTPSAPHGATEPRVRIHLYL
jgi:hypothetical protein